MIKNIMLALTILLTISLMSCSSGVGNSNSNDSGGNKEGTSNLPPEPGEQGKLTLEGVDSDNDGVRDDVQIAIVKRYPNDAGKQAVLRQEAKALQGAVVAGNSSDTNMIIQASKSVLSSVDCLHERMEDPSSDISFLEDKVINTSERSKAYIKFNEALSGQFFGDGDTENPCQSMQGGN